MGLLDKVESNETKEPKKAVAKAAKAAKVAEAVPVAAKAAKPKKEKKPKVKKARPASLSSDFEIAPKLSRVISWWVNFIANFSVLIAGLVMSALTGGSSGGLETTILFLVAIVVLFFNAIFLPIYTGRNLGQYTSSTRYIRGDGSKPLFLHSLFVNNIGLLALIGFIMVFVQVGQISGGGTAPIVMTSVGSVLMVLWIVNWVVSFDLNSLYPSLIRFLNISPETLVDRKHPNSNVQRMINKEADLSWEEDFCVAANGAMYRKDKVGFMPELVTRIYNERKQYKKTMLEKKQELVNIEEELKRRGIA